MQWLPVTIQNPTLLRLLSALKPAERAHKFNSTAADPVTNLGKKFKKRKKEKRSQACWFMCHIKHFYKMIKSTALKKLVLVPS